MFSPGNCAWESVEVLTVLMRLSMEGLYEQVKRLIRSNCFKFVEVILLSLSLITDAALNRNCVLKHELLEEFLPALIAPSTPAQSNRKAVLSQIWGNGCNSYVVNACLKMYEKDPSQLGILVDTLRQQKIPNGIDVLLSVRNRRFALDAAVVASRDLKLMSLNAWLLTLLKSDPRAVNDVLWFLQFKVLKAGPWAERDRAAAQSGIAIDPDTVALMFKTLKESTEGNEQLQEEIKRVYAECSRALPNLGAPGSGSGSSSDEIEQLANEAFQLIYTSQQTNAEVIEMLKNYKNSEKKKEREIFNCMIHNLFDEYRYGYVFQTTVIRCSYCLPTAFVVGSSTSIQRKS